MTAVADTSEVRSQGAARVTEPGSGEIVVAAPGARPLAGDKRVCSPRVGAR